MSKRSTATVREQPVAQATSVSGAFQIRGETFTIETRTRTEIVDLTERVMALVRTLGLREGLLHVFSMHTTCTLFLNEHQQALVDDALAAEGKNVCIIVDACFAGQLRLSAKSLLTRYRDPEQGSIILMVSSMPNQTSAACGSLVIALALLEGRLNADQAFAASQLDESFQIEAWGEDTEQAKRRAALAAEIVAAARFVSLLRA